ncbi:MAG: urea transporter [Rikenellaceae bacterium]|nr:urea transporter [Rikenellaceae bacterium]
MSNLKLNDELRNLTPLEHLRIFLRGAGQVMFQPSAWTGLLFIIGIFWGAYSSHTPEVAWGALLGLFVSTLTGYLIDMPSDDGKQGLWGFNGVLVGCAFPTFLGNTVWVWIALVLCSAMTVWVRTGMNNVMAPWRVNSFTFPFVFCTWIFILAARAMNSMPPEHLPDPTLPEVFSSTIDLHMVNLITYCLEGVSQVFLIESWVTGLLFLIGLAISSPIAALTAFGGSALALLVALVFGTSGAETSHGLYSFSAVLTALAIGVVFYKPNLHSALWAIIATIVTVFMQAAMNVLLLPLGIATLTAPFCVTTWLFLLPLLAINNEQNLDHSNWNPENKHHLAKRDHSQQSPKN